jgi:hypothetical protein
MLSSFTVLCVLKSTVDIFVAPAAGNNIQIQITVLVSVQYVQISERQILVTEKRSQLESFFFWHKSCFTFLPP